VLASTAQRRQPRGPLPSAHRAAALPALPRPHQAGLILGYQHFDGEGCRVSREDALRCFKLAAANGEAEAEEVIGWIYSTGQYG
jgi:TPR repeat protein